MKTFRILPTNLGFLLNTIGKRKKIIPKKPRKERSKILALEYLIYKNINYLPINLEAFDYVFENYEWLVYKYEDAKLIMQVEDPFNIKKRNALARTLHERGSNVFVTVFIEDKQFPKRNYYTLAHELGHIVLGHFFEFEKTSLLRSGLLDEEYAVLEREAEIFAAELLMPMPVLKGLKIKSYEDIVNVCKVTKTSAQIRMEEFQKFRLTNRMFIPYIEVKKQFHDFIYKRYCPNCRYYCISNKFVYCPICGQKLQWGDGTMKYNDGYELDEKGKVLKCPICGNEEVGESEY
ncbi:MAG TPA: ImmA/IrrE family metallo-endopeptidase, partial [Clostridia bacterium]